MDIKLKETDVQKLINVDILQIYNKLDGLLGEYNIFAKFSTGFGFYQWHDIRYPWKSITQASAKENVLALQALFDAREYIGQFVDEITLDKIFTVPSDECKFFYISPDGAVKVLLTGWGFRLPIKPPKPGFSDPLPISIRFVSHGCVLPNYEFELKLPFGNQRLSTGHGGLYVTKPLKVGSTFIVVDLKSNIEHSFVVSKTAQTCDIEVVARCNVTIKVNENNCPVNNECVLLKYLDKEYTLNTDSNGECHKTLIVLDDNDVIVSVRNETKIEPVRGDAILIEFDILMPQPETDIYSNLIVSAFTGPHPVVDELVDVEYMGKIFQLKLDRFGHSSIPLLYKDGNEVSARLRDAEQTTVLEKDVTIIEFKFDEPLPQQSKIIVKGLEDGKPISTEQVDVLYRGNLYNIMLDSNGIGEFYADYIENEFIKATLRGVSKISNISLDNNLIVFDFVSSKPHTPDCADLTFIFRDANYMPLKCSKVTFAQNQSSKIEAIPDSEGKLILPKDSFDIKYPITIYIDSGKDIEYNPVTFSLELDETSYVFQLEETKPKSNVWSQVLLFVLIAIFLIILWPYASDLINSFFDALYH